MQSYIKYTGEDKERAKREELERKGKNEKGLSVCEMRHGGTALRQSGLLIAQWKGRTDKSKHHTLKGQFPLPEQTLESFLFPGTMMASGYLGRSLYT